MTLFVKRFFEISEMYLTETPSHVTSNGMYCSFRDSSSQWMEWHAPRHCTTPEQAVSQLLLSAGRVLR